MKNDVIAQLEGRGLLLGRVDGDREDVPADFRYLDLLLRAAGDPEVGMGVMLVVRMLRLPTLFKQKEEKLRVAGSMEREGSRGQGGKSW